MADLRTEALRRQAAARQARARRSQADSSVSIDSPPSLGPSETTPYSPRTPMQEVERALRGPANFLRDVYSTLTEGASIGARDEILGLADAALGRGTVQENVQARQDEYQAIDPSLRAMGETIGAVGTTGLGGPVRSMLARSIIPGAATGYNVGEGSPMERLPSAAIGAVTGGVLDTATGAIARAISPRSSPQVQTVTNELGVTPTPGQALGGRARALEERLKSMPILGPSIRAAEQRANNQLNVGTVNYALRPAGLSVPENTPPGRELVVAAEEQINEAYRRAIPRSTVVRYTRDMADEVSRVVAYAEEILDDSGLRKLRAQARKITQPGRSSGTEMTGETAQKVLSEMRRARRNALAKDPDLADAIGEIEDVFQRQLEASVPDRAFYRSLQKSYANWKRVQRAAASKGADEGAFSAAQLQSAVHAMDPSRDKAQFARGQALMQEVSEPARSVLMNRVPNSGTTDRALTAATYLGGGAGLALDPVTTAAIGGAALGAPSLAYTPWAQQAIVNAITGRQGLGYQLAADAVRRATTPATVITTQQMAR